MPNPVIWLTTPVVTEVTFILFYERKDLMKEIMGSECMCLPYGKKEMEILSIAAVKYSTSVE
jgi:hypothetical protein